MRVVRVIESKVWLHKTNGRRVSPYGALPWVRPQDKADWELVSQGWTWQMDDGSIGLGRVPAATEVEAEKFAVYLNAQDDARKAQHRAWRAKVEAKENAAAQLSNGELKALIAEVEALGYVVVLKPRKQRICLSGGREMTIGQAIIRFRELLANNA